MGQYWIDESLVNSYNRDISLPSIVFVNLQKNEETCLSMRNVSRLFGMKGQVALLQGLSSLRDIFCGSLEAEDS